AVLICAAGYRWAEHQPDQRRCRALTSTDRIEPIHPGEVLMEDFIEGLGITQNKLAVSNGVPPRWINEIVHGKRGITADTALRLARYFGTSAGFWINLQRYYELELGDIEAYDAAKAEGGESALLDHEIRRP